MTIGMDEIDEISEMDVPADIEPELCEYLPRGYLSPSQVGTFQKCNRLWALSYLAKKPRRTNARMFQGIFVHEGVETVLKERINTGKLLPLEAATDAFSDAFDKSKDKIEDWEELPPSVVKDVGVACTKAYYTEAASDATPVEVEKTFTKVITSPDGKVRLPILGRIDSIQVQAHTEQEYQDIREALNSSTHLSKPLTIHDLKVTTDKWSPDDLANDLAFTLYAGAMGIPDVQVDQVVKGRAKIEAPKYKIKPPHYEKLTGVVTPHQVAHAEAVVLGVAKTIALFSGRFEPEEYPMTNPDNWWCSVKWCAMWHHCRGKKK